MDGIDPQHRLRLLDRLDIEVDGDRFVRNVLIAIGNSGEPGLLDAVRPLLADASPLVRAMAAWTWLRLAPTAERERMRTAQLRSESDPAVRAEWGSPAA